MWSGASVGGDWGGRMDVALGYKMGVPSGGLREGLGFGDVVLVLGEGRL